MKNILLNVLIFVSYYIIKGHLFGYFNLVLTRNYLALFVNEIRCGKNLSIRIT